MSFVLRVWLCYNVLVAAVNLQTIHSFVFSRHSSPPPSTCKYSSHNTDVTSEINIAKIEEEENSWKSSVKNLCDERNIPFEQVKNARDLSSAKNSPIKPGCIYRMGKVSDATRKDTEFLRNVFGVKTLIDLRSPTELKEDPALHSNAIFKDFTSLIWKNGKTTQIGNSNKSKSKAAEYGGNSTLSLKESIKRTVRYDESPNRKERHFVSLIDELKYFKGTLRKLSKRDKVKALVQLPGAIVSRRVRHRVKDVFLTEINGGGLPMLNELLLQMGAPGIKYVLNLMADRNRYPIAFYCTAGKDRTGVISALLLSIMGVPEEDIVEDYSLSANVYAQINDHKAMVGALSQRNLNPETFLGAPPHVMRDTLENIRSVHGSVNGYLDWIGFREGDRERLKQALRDQ